MKKYGLRSQGKHLPSLCIVVSFHFVSFLYAVVGIVREREEEEGNEERRYCHGFRNTVQEAKLSRQGNGGVAPLILLRFGFVM
jgi:hypothetical protein